MVIKAKANDFEKSSRKGSKGQYRSILLMTVLALLGTTGPTRSGAFLFRRAALSAKIIDQAPHGVGETDCIAVSRHRYNKVSLGKIGYRSFRKINTSTLLGLSSPSSQPPLSLYLPRDTTRASPIQTVAAPMVAASDYAFRCLCRQYGGVDLTYTQMFHARNWVSGRSYPRTHLDLYEVMPPPTTLLRAQRDLVRLLPTSESIAAAGGGGGEATTTLATELMIPDPAACHGPVMVQLAGNEPEVVVQAAQMILDATEGGVHGFDLNCGCPQAIARKGMYGSFLMEHDDGATVCRVLHALRQALPADVAVSVKIRLPTAGPHLLQSRLEKLVATGINFITIHGRTLKENKTNVGPCHVDQIQQAVEILRPFQIPVVSNGGIEFYPDVARIRQETGAAAVMSSEALLETPNVFRVDSSQLTPRDMFLQQFRITRDYMIWCRRFPPVPGVLGSTGSLSVTRGHILKFLHRYLNQHPDVRDRMTMFDHGEDRPSGSLDRLESLVAELHGRYEHILDDPENDAWFSDDNISWYRRHWSAAARTHRRTVGVVEVFQPTIAMTLDERKEQIKNRIKVLQRRNLARDAA